MSNAETGIQKTGKRIKRPVKKIKLAPQFRLFDFNVITKQDEDEEMGSDEETSSWKPDTDKFIIQTFGINEKGETASIIVEGFNPFFYISVSDSWIDNDPRLYEVLANLRDEAGKYFEKSVLNCSVVKHKKLYGFDAGKLHNFIKIEFASVRAMNKIKNLWYTKWSKDMERKLLRGGYEICKEKTQLYEANIPPMLRYFHIQEISPTGWVKLENTKTTGAKKTSCNYNYTVNHCDVKPLNDKETLVPFKICSFDIEASSSHGDFPLPKKTYKKLATNMIDIIGDKTNPVQDSAAPTVLKQIIHSAFGFDFMDDVDRVYPKFKCDETFVNKKTNEWIKRKYNEFKNTKQSDDLTIEKMFEKNMEEEDSQQYPSYQKKGKSKILDTMTIVDIILDDGIDRETKIGKVTCSLDALFPSLEGDKVTFIGSTFMKYGEKEPYFNHCIGLYDCDKIDNVQVDTYNTEKEVLMAWTELIQKENPDIIIGYNIFGFDYQFMFIRAQELHCEEEFLKLSRNEDEICGVYDPEKGAYAKIEESSVVLATGQYDLHYIKMPGRIQIDMHNFLRRDYNLTSYKLDYVASHFVGDKVKTLNYKDGNTVIQSKNLTGLEDNAFINIEESSHSTDYYKNGQKFKVKNVNKDDGTFEIAGEEHPDMTKNVRWGLVKDDVSPQDIFQMSHISDDTKDDEDAYIDRAVIAKYCIQDCNLVHHLMTKIDVITGFIEMGNICSVPINFLVMRGQGIKLTSYISKKCREKDTLMPVIDKGAADEGYEGAIVLEPKCGLYDRPVACLDYSSLYPSSMISENISHDSKVWSKEYNLSDVLIKETGETDSNGNYIYDNIPEYKYVDIKYDAFKYVRKTPKSAAVKVKCGYKVCRYAQYPEGKAILPSILEELLAERKATRKLIPKQTDDFMKNVLDKRQLSIKMTANSLYGQTGAKTSTFYEKDVAASTTAIGRKLLLYGKRVIEEVYNNRICDTSQGKVKTYAEYVYGDTDSVFFTFNLHDLDEKPIKGKKALELTIELAQEAGEVSSFFLKKPHDFEYEKTFDPLFLVSKKRYVGMLFETDANKGYRKEMGLVLKRRDNADIVKDVYGGIVDILMKNEGIDKSVEYLRKYLQDLIDENIPHDKLIITKSLRGGYKNPNQIAHKVLADRIGKRDPGNKPKPGDRIPFIYVQNDKKGALQGEKIELPNYIVENKLNIDYGHYITNQIMKPVQQLFALILEQVPEFSRKILKARKFKQTIEGFKKTLSKEDAEKKETNLRNKEVEQLLFEKYLKKINNSRNNQISIMTFMR